MDKIRIRKLISSLAKRDYRRMYMNDFFLTWEKTDDEIAATFLVAEILRGLREANISCRMFDSGLGISLFRDNSTRTRFSFASACNLLGLEVQDLDEGKSQIAHGETVRETANMISFMADVIGIRDDMYIGKGNAYMHTVSEAVQEGYRDGVLEQRPTLVNLQCDIDHPTQCMADMLHIINHFGGVEKLKGKKIAMSWAYSPSYGKPLSVPQGVIGLMTRFGMDVVLAHPEGYKVHIRHLACVPVPAACLGIIKILLDRIAHHHAHLSRLRQPAFAQGNLLQKGLAYAHKGQILGLVGSLAHNHIDFQDRGYPGHMGQAAKLFYDIVCDVGGIRGFAAPAPSSHHRAAIG